MFVFVIFFVIFQLRICVILFNWLFTLCKLFRIKAIYSSIIESIFSIHLLVVNNQFKKFVT